LPIRKAYRYNSFAAFAEAEMALFKFGAMGEILGNDASRIIKRILSFKKS